MKDGMVRDVATVKRAMPIEDLLEWTYRAQRADLVLGRADNRERNWLSGAGISADGCAIVERQGILGTRVDGGGYAAADLHPDAEAVHLHIGLMLRSGALSHVQVGLLLECGKTGGIPPWELDEKPKPKKIPASVPGGALIEGGRYKRYCPLRWEPPQGLENDMRSIYLDWYRALVRLMVALSVSGALSEHSALPPSISEKPWAA